MAYDQDVIDRIDPERMKESVEKMSERVYYAGMGAGALGPAKGAV